MTTPGGVFMSYLHWMSVLPVIREYVGKHGMSSMNFCHWTVIRLAAKFCIKFSLNVKTINEVA